jgi:peptidoglycan/xylan/chitin deacetylase (PgdA/CDA1 family)
MRIKNMIFSKIAVLGLIISNPLGVAGQGYTLPTVWPSTDQNKMISGDLLTAPLVADAMAKVNAVVPAQYLNIPPAKYISGSTVKYNSDPVANCYWPNNLCIRATDTANWKADIHSCPDANAWGLTYDDGPTVSANADDTGGIRDALESANLKATFFVVGSNAIQFPEEVNVTHQSGNQIALHTWTHHPMTSLTNEQIVAELKYNEAIIYKAAGVLPIYFRPPYGDIDDRVRAIVNALGYKIVIWTTSPNRDSTDADVTPSSDEKTSIENTVQSWFAAQPGFISLEHDISTFSSNLAVSIIQDIKAAGASFPLKPMPVGTCMHDANWYSNVGPVGVDSPPTTPAPKQPTGTNPSTPSTHSGATQSAGTQALYVILVGVVAANL